MRVDIATMLEGNAQQSRPSLDAPQPVRVGMQVEQVSQHRSCTTVLYSCLPGVPCDGLLVVVCERPLANPVIRL